MGAFAAPGKGSLRSDAVLRAPEDGVPVLFVEVDNHTEPPVTVARKIERYQRFFQRTVKEPLRPQCVAVVDAVGRLRTPWVSAGRLGVHEGGRTEGDGEPDAGCRAPRTPPRLGVRDPYAQLHEHGLRLAVDRDLLGTGRLHRLLCSARSCDDDLGQRRPRTPAGRARGRSRLSLSLDGLLTPGS
ncbi:replication-relaxation family protein [Streptomyces sp. NBC_01221]|uniref:replication-relaxation family protein n=1 Tax=Streptomyces sp. NBC_01221 TaxID=2903782 RepID=UPI00338E7C48